MTFNIDEILNHRPPMLMLDALTESTETHAIAQKTFRPSDYGVSGDFVTEPALIECMAQAMAAYRGQIARERNIAPQPGLLVGVRDAQLLSRVRCGELLEIRVKITHRVGDFAVASCRVRRGEEIVASAMLKFYVAGMER